MSIKIMEINLDEALEASKKIIIHGREGSNFRKYDRGYFMSNENIKRCLKAVPFNKTRAFTILGGGDHVFNLAHLGVPVIDAIDVNELEYFVYHFRFAMLQVLNRKGFIAGNETIFATMAYDSILELLELIKNEMPGIVYEYYRRLLEHCKQFDWFLGYLYSEPELQSFITFNSYLGSDDDYNRLREKMREVEVNLHFGDALEFAKSTNNQYGIMLLSNIQDYWSVNRYPFTIKDFKEMLSYFEGLLEEDGVLMNYLFNAGFKMVVRGTFITREELGLENICQFEKDAYSDGVYVRRRCKVK